MKPYWMTKAAVKKMLPPHALMLKCKIYECTLALPNREVREDYYQRWETLKAESKEREDDE